jgi:hypothetical protein
MASLDARLTRLETALRPAHDPPPWAAVDAAQRRQAARVRRRLGERLGLAASDPCMVEARAWVVGDDPARRAADDDLIARWHRAQGFTEEVRGARDRLAERLATMARRQGGDDHGLDRDVPLVPGHD